MCPSCEVGRDAREMALSDGFWIRAWYVVVPFVVVLLMIGWLVRRLERGERDEA